MFNGFLDYFGVEKTVERVDDSYPSSLIDFSTVSTHMAAIALVT